MSGIFRFLVLLFTIPLPESICQVILECGTDEVITVVEPLEIAYPGRNETYGTGEHCLWIFKGYGPLKMTFTKLDLGVQSKETCSDYVYAAGHIECRIFYSGFVEKGDFVLEFFSDEFDEGNKGFEAVIENECLRFQEKCDYKGSSDVNSENLLVYMLRPEEEYPHSELDFKDHEGQEVSGHLTLEILLFGGDMGATFCFDCAIIIGSFDSPSCHADMIDSCRWNLGSDVYISPGHIDTKGKVFLLSGRKPELVTKDSDLRLKEVCLYVEYLVKNDRRPLLTLKAISGESEESKIIWTNKLELKESWTMEKIVATVPEVFQEEGFGLIVEVEDEEEVELLINKLYGCDPQTPDFDRVLIQNQTVRNYKILSFYGNKLRDRGKCRNGGKRDGTSCKCLPGFGGDHCEVECQPGWYGPNCQIQCPDSNCRGIVICKRNLGCHCASGFKGLYCNTTCAPGEFGANCLQKCGKCVGVCNPFTGACEKGCMTGYSEPRCFNKFPRLLKAPHITPNYTHAIIKIALNNATTFGINSVNFYQIQYTNDSSKGWVKKELRSFPKEDLISYNLTGLEAGTSYLVRIVLSEDQREGYAGDDIPVVSFFTNCDGFNALNVNWTATHDSIFLKWEEISPKLLVISKHKCPFKEVLVQIMIGTDWVDYSVNTSSLNISSLRAGKDYKIRIRSIYAEDKEATKLTIPTLPSVSGRVNYLESGKITGSSAELSWMPVGRKGRAAHIFRISWACVRLLAQSSAHCDTDTGSKETNNPKLWVRNLLPYRKYKFRVQEFPGNDFSQIFLTTKPGLPTTKPESITVIADSTTATFRWKQPDNCSLCNGFIIGYQYRLLTENGRRKYFSSTAENTITLDELEPSTRYIFQVFLRNTEGWNDQFPAEVEIVTKEDAKIGNVHFLTVYKRGKGEVGLKWIPPHGTNNSETFLVVKATGDGEFSYRGKPSVCISWPTQQCFTAKGLQENTVYNFSVALGNGETGEEGPPSFVAAVTSEGPPDSPWDLRWTEATETSIGLEWRPPGRANGILRAFVATIRQTEGPDCCRTYPDVRVPVKEELEKYRVTVGGLKPAAAYAVAVSAETVSLGPPAAVAAVTRPPRPRAPLAPNMAASLPVLWPAVPQPPAGSSSSRGPFALLVLCNFTYEDNVRDADLRTVLRAALGSGFYVAAEYSEGEAVRVGSGASAEGVWGRLADPALVPGRSYTLAAAAILKFHHLYNAAVIVSKPFVAV